jgi:EAL domain-containing protein (putative c-di-GMP-specific phosphodiesterase class I)
MRSGRISAVDHEPLLIAFQSIVDLWADRRTVGVEALSRFPDGDGDPSCWFRDADLLGLGTELESTAIRRTLEALPRLPDDVYLAVNASPATLMSPSFLDLFAHAGPGRVVVEMTEHAPVDDYAILHERLDQLASAGVRLAVDDAGAGYASLRHILKLHPDVIKLDISLTSNIDREPLQRALAAALVKFARELGASIIAEGAERPEESRRSHGTRCPLRPGLPFRETDGRPARPLPGVTLQPPNRSVSRRPARSTSSGIVSGFMLNISPSAPAST